MNRSIHVGYFFATLTALAVITLTEIAGFSRLEVAMTPGRLILVLLFGQMLGYLMYYLVQFFEWLQQWGPWSVGIMYGLALWVVVLPIASASTLIAPVMDEGTLSVISTLVAFISYGVVVTNYTMIRLAD
ncbi:hypothetical protein MFMK1_002419 [Metallumcola ferriviriculae]|uniref:Uncharacterized protein n=1 Tax=Metallumcola ferriviriculae TaxID=3039180 RepID=A0AAU0UP67_9FIRM|nr:hypothetical protein MFMK1_002419 [Desulfitibacteraceae bacterium MK1]